MPFKPLVLPALLVALISACNGQKQSMAQDAPPSDHGTSTVHYASAPDSVFFLLRRTPCFGTCPAYTITILGDGRASYSGNAHVERLGEYTGRVEEAMMQALYERAKEIGFFKLEDRYDGQVTDLPSTIIRVSADGHDKRVVVRVGPPAAFKRYASYADSLLAGVKWMPVETK